MTGQKAPAPSLIKLSPFSFMIGDFLTFPYWSSLHPSTYWFWFCCGCSDATLSSYSQKRRSRNSVVMMILSWVPSLVLLNISSSTMRSPDQHWLIHIPKEFDEFLNVLSQTKTSSLSFHHCFNCASTVPVWLFPGTAPSYNQVSILGQLFLWNEGDSLCPCIDFRDSNFCKISISPTVNPGSPRMTVPC